MTKKIITLFLLFSYLVCLHAQDSKEISKKLDGKTVKVISYNILNGFEYGKEPERRAAFVEWVKKQAPDVLALQELCGLSEKDLQILAKEYGHNYVAIVKEEGYPVGLTSTKPIEVVARKVEGYGHGMLHCRTYSLDFLVTHLNPFDWKTRKKQAQNILGYIEEAQIENYLVMGDLNAHSPFDADVQDTHTELLNGMRAYDLKHKEKHQNLYLERYEYAVISSFLAHSLIDICQVYIAAESRFTYPTGIWTEVAKRKELQLRKERIDYIFVSDKVFPLCVNAHIYNGAQNDDLSDHYPTGVELYIPNEY